MAELTVDQVIQIHKDGLTDLRQFHTLYRDAYRYSQPSRNAIDRPAKGESRTDVLFDSTATKALDRSTNKLQDLIFPPGKIFLKPQPGPRFDNQNQQQKTEIAKKLDEVNEKWHAALWRSNFQTVINEFLEDLFIGTGALIFNSGTDDDPFVFQAFPQFSVTFREGPWGTVADMGREIELHPSDAQATWPDAVIPEDEKSLDRKEENKRTYLEMTYSDFDGNMAGPGVEVQARPKRWLYVVVDMKEKKFILKEPREYKSASPWIVTRYRKSPGEVRGRGPVIQALGHIRTANKAVELVLKNASLAISGIWTALDDGVFNPDTATFRAGSVIPVGSNGGARGKTLEPLEFPGNFDISQLVLEDLRTQIKEILFDISLPPLQGPVRSATEFIERIRETLMDIGPAAGRIQKELLEPLYIRGLVILRNKGIIDLPATIQLDSQNITISVTGPLGQRQALENIEKVVRWIELSRFFGPEVVAATIKVENLPRYFAEQLGVDMDLVRDEAEGQNLLQIVAGIVAQQMLAQRGGQQQQGAAAA